MITLPLREKSAETTSVFLRHGARQGNRGWWSGWPVLLALRADRWSRKWACLSVRWAHAGAVSIKGRLTSRSVCHMNRIVFHIRVTRVKADWTKFIFQKVVAHWISVVWIGTQRFWWWTHCLQLPAKNKYGLLTLCKLFCRCRYLLLLRYIYKI